MDPTVTLGAAPIVLVVDDDEDLLAVLRDVIEEEGYRVSTACDGEAALALLEADETPMAPRVASGVAVYYLRVRSPWTLELGADPAGQRLEAALLARARLSYDDTAAGIDDLTIGSGIGVAGGGAAAGGEAAAAGAQQTAGTTGRARRGGGAKERAR